MYQLCNVKSLENYKNKCRTCLAELDSKVHIRNHQEILEKCTTLRLDSTDKSLNEYICKSCENELLKFSEFIQKCNKVDLFLKELKENTLDKEKSSTNKEVGNSDCNECHLCMKVFTRKFSLKIHLERHQGRKNYRCTKCSKDFTTNQDLKIHLKTHQTNLLKCDICSKTFRTKSSIIKHMRIHIGIKPNLCPYCGKKFLTTETFQTHLKLHTGHDLLKCHFCNEKFVARFSLHLHLKKHTGERPFLCSNCGAKFRTSSELKKHENGHLKTTKTKTNNNQFICTLCKKGFNRKNNYNRHLKNIHKALN